MTYPEIRFSQRALEDLENIDAYFSNISTVTSTKVLDDIYDVFQLLKLHPKVGRLNSTQQFRIFPSRKYRFIITYLPHDEFIEILKIFRYQNENYR